jgi:hypothetical protein
LKFDRAWQVEQPRFILIGGQPDTERPPASSPTIFAPIIPGRPELSLKRPQSGHQQVYDCSIVKRDGGE